MAKRLFSSLIWIIIITVIYVLAGKLGLSLAFLNKSASAVWPPTGLALAALLLVGWRVLPAIFLGAFIVNYHITPGTPVVTALIIATGNIVEAIVGAALARRFARGQAAFEQAPDIFRFVFFAVIPSCTISATVGVYALVMNAGGTWQAYVPVWLTWWTGDLVSDLLVAPLIVSWWRHDWPQMKLSRVLEAAALAILMLGVSVVIFTTGPISESETYSLAYLGVPLLLWAAFRFHQAGATMAALIMSAVAVYETVHGEGPFASSDPNSSLLMLQSFVGVNTLTMLVLAAVVAERTKFAATLGNNEQRLRMALDAGKMGTWEWDIVTGAVRWSAALEEIHGLARGAFAGTFDATWQTVHPDDREARRQQLARALKGEAEFFAEYRLLVPDGEVKWLESRGRVIRDSHGRPRRMIGISMDITARKSIQQEREQLLQRERAARTQAERASRAKDDFLAILSHELRTPLTPVMLTTSLLETDPSVPQHIREDLLTIRRNVELEARLIDDLLDLTRISRGKLQLQMQTTDIHMVVRRALDICFQDAKVNVDVHLNAARHFVRADTGRLQQVFWNLLNNARKFTPAGGMITVRSHDNAEGQIVLDVSDTGVGIEPSLLPKLFNAFEQGDSEHARRTGGLGLGLAISRALVIAHGGTLSVHSEGVGKGATFTVRVPTVAQPAASADGEKLPNVPATPGRMLKILVVEDHAGTLQAMTRLLTSQNHQVVPATSVASAIQAAEREEFDLLISDLGLPDGLGYDIMRTIRGKHPIPGIALSGYGMAGDVQQSRDAGFAEHLTKPVDLVTLEAAITRAMAVA